MFHHYWCSISSTIYIHIWQICPLRSCLRVDSWKAIGIFFLSVLCFFMMDTLDLDRPLHRWPALWRAPNTAVLMSCLSEGPFGFNKLINLYLLSSRHDRIKKANAVPIFHLTARVLLTNCLIEVQRRNCLLSFFLSLIQPQGFLVEMFLRQVMSEWWNMKESMIEMEVDAERWRGVQNGENETNYIRVAGSFPGWCNGWKLEVMTPHLNVFQWTSDRPSSR